MTNRKGTDASDRDRITGVNMGSAEHFHVGDGKQRRVAKSKHLAGFLNHPDWESRGDDGHTVLVFFNPAGMDGLVVSFSASTPQPAPL